MYIPISNSDVWNICSCNVITTWSIFKVISSNPMLFDLNPSTHIIHETHYHAKHNHTSLACYKNYLCTYLMVETTHQHRVSCQFTHVTWTEFPHLSSNTVFFHQRLLIEIEWSSSWLYNYPEIHVRTLVKWNWSGSSVERETKSPLSK